VYIPVALVVNVVYFVVKLVAIFAFIPLLAFWVVAGVLWSGVLKEDLRVFLFGSEDEDVEVKSLCGVEEEFEGLAGGEVGEGDANGGDQWQHTDTDYISSDDNEEESKTDSVGKEESERPSTPPDQTGVESEKVDSVMRGQMEQREASSTGRDEGASPKARSRYKRES